MIRLAVTSIFVVDQQLAFDFYTSVLGFSLARDIPIGNARWLTVTAPGGPEGIELLLEPGDGPIAAPYRQALYEAGIPATAFAVDNLDAEYARLEELGVVFAGEPVDAPGGARVAAFDDTCGNFIQLFETGE